MIMVEWQHCFFESGEKVERGGTSGGLGGYSSLLDDEKLFPEVFSIHSTHKTLS